MFFQHVSSSFHLVTQADVSFPPISAQEGRCRGFETSFAAGIPTSTKSSELALLQHLSQILLNAYKKNNPGHAINLSRKQTDAGGERGCPSSRRAEANCRIMLRVFVRRGQE